MAIKVELTLDQIKELILFAKTQGVKHLVIDKIQVLFEDHAQRMDFSDLEPSKDDILFGHLKR